MQIDIIDLCLQCLLKIYGFYQQVEAKELRQPSNSTNCNWTGESCVGLGHATGIGS